MNGKLFITLLIMVVLGIGGCSNGNGNAITPEEPGQTALVNEPTPDEGRSLLGIWDISFDPATMEVTAIPSRGVDTHFEVKNWLLPPACNDCLKVIGNSYDPVTKVFNLDVTIRNPTHLTARDVRGIIFNPPQDTFQFPSWVLLNADDYTKYWEPGYLGIPFNPFKAFAKDQEFRAFPPSTEFTENYLIDVGDIGPLSNLQFAVDISWPGNTNEPYEISNFQQTEMLSIQDFQCGVSVDVLDWQDDVKYVVLNAKELTGEPSTYLTKIGDVTWGAYIHNATALFPGTYTFTINSYSEDSSYVKLYDRVDFKVTAPESTVSFTDVSPSWLNFSTGTIAVDGNYAFVGTNKITIFDITGKANPEFITEINGLNSISDIQIIGGLAYLLGIHYFYIYDISDIFNPVELAKTYVNSSSSPSGFVINEGYAYVWSWENGFSIIDINPIAEMNVVSEEYNSSKRGVGLYSGYIFCPTLAGKFQVYEPQADGSLELVSEITDAPPVELGMIIQDNYAYIPLGSYNWGTTGLYIVDITNPLNPIATQSLEFQGGSFDGMTSSSDKLFIKGYGDVNIIDIGTPGVAYLKETLHGWGVFEDISASDGYLYITGDNWLDIYDIDPQGPIDKVGVEYSLIESRGADILGNIMYVRVPDGFDIVDISDPDNINITGHISWPDWPYTTYDLILDDGYLYIISAYNLGIFSLADPEDPVLVEQLEVPGWNTRVASSNGRLFIGGEDTVSIVDVTTPGSASIVKVIDVPDKVLDIEIEGNYVYVKIDAYGLVVVDISNIDTAGVIAALEFPGSFDLTGILIQNSTLYLTDKELVRIIDISNPASPVEIQALPFQDSFSDLKIFNGFLFGGGGSLTAIKLQDGGPAYVTGSIGLPYPMTTGMDISDGYAYLAGMRGMNVIKIQS